MRWLEFGRSFICLFAASGARANCLVSGCGDGALINLFRLTNERFRQYTTIDELLSRGALGASGACQRGTAALEIRGAMGSRPFATMCVGVGSA